MQGHLIKLKGLYSLIAKRGLYFENKNGYDGLAGATVQMTKNFATLGDMLDDEDNDVNISGDEVKVVMLPPNESD